MYMYIVRWKQINLKLETKYQFIDIEYNKRLDRQRPCFEDELIEWSNL